MPAIDFGSPLYICATLDMSLMDAHSRHPSKHTRNFFHCTGQRLRFELQRNSARSVAGIQLPMQLQRQGAWAYIRHEPEHCTARARLVCFAQPPPNANVKASANFEWCALAISDAAAAPRQGCRGAAALVCDLHHVRAGSVACAPSTSAVERFATASCGAWSGQMEHGLSRLQ